jgi:Flp pilus assembly protein TadG
MTARPARRGTIVPLLAVCCVALFGFVALAIDLGMLMVARSECQNAADAAALAAARVLDNRFPTGSDPEAYDNRRPLAEATARTVVTDNWFLNTKFALGRVRTARAGLYDYDPATERFGPYFPSGKPTGKSWTAVEVVVDGEQPAYFAHVLGIATLPTAARAVAAHRPRDVALVLDMSGSMQFSSTTHWEPGTAGSNDVVYGLLNPDPHYPRFGHYARFAQYQATTPAKGQVFNSTAGGRPNPLRMTGAFVGATGEVFAPNNHTIETPSGPPLVRDFYFDPSNLADPRAAAVTVASGDNLRNAFHRWDPPMVGAGNPNALIPPTYDWGQYSAFDTTNTRGPVPAPPTFAEQSNETVTYVGDRFPRKGGVILTTNATWDPAASTGAARTLLDVLFATGTTPAATTRTIPASRPAVANGNRTEGGTDWGNFYDDGWERNGYDLDVPTYISSNRATANVRVNNPFQGRSMGPGYWGKTFFMWPPDPRWGGGSGAARPDLPAAGNSAKDAGGNWIADWRRRFFLRGNSPDTGSPTTFLYFDPQLDNDPLTTGTQNVNQALLRGGIGHVLRDGAAGPQRNYRVNYRAVLAWLRSPPNVLPPNLRAGRVLYYTSIPEHVDNFATDADQRFWRDYIDFVLGYNGNVSGYDPRYTLAGVENMPWPDGHSIAINGTSSYDPDGPPPPNPLPYMNLADNPNRPRMHFWFGPATMLAFLTTRAPAKNWLPGNAHEAQGWQLKVGVQSAVEDIKNNHPNDHVGLAFFGYPHYTAPRVAVGQDWVSLRNALYFPRTLLPQLQVGNQSAEVRAFNAGFGSALLGNLPNANGQTDPNTGLALAFNMLRGPTAGGNGRKGAAKIVLFETDGVPNAFQGFTLGGSGENATYSYDGTGGVRSNGDPGVVQRAYDVAAQLALPVTEGGHSLPSSPARIYPIAFGDLFSSNSSFRPTALSFLGTVAYLGKTAERPTDPLPAAQVITGPSQTRIDNLRYAFERILQSGVQVTLIE